MSMRQQVRWNPFTYTPGQPEPHIVRLAQRIQAADVADGIDRPWPECVALAREDWRYVTAMEKGAAP